MEQPASIPTPKLDGKTIEGRNKIFVGANIDGTVDVKAYPVKSEAVCKLEAALLTKLKSHPGILNCRATSQDDVSAFPWLMVRDPSPKGNLRGAIDKNKFASTKETDWQRYVFINKSLTLKVSFGWRWRLRNQ
jgi:hypothetical protein